MAKKVMHQLQQIRKNLRMTHKEFAELLGGEDNGWYERKIQRLESGLTRMNEETASEVAEILSINFIDIWKEPEDSDVLMAFHKAPDHVKQTIRTLLGTEE